GARASRGFAEEYPRLAFSRPYYTMGHAIVARAGGGVSGLSDLARVTTAVEALSAGDLFLLEKRYARRTYRTQEAAFDAVRAGEMPAALLWAPMAGWFAKRWGGSGLELIPVAGADLSVPFGIGFLRGSSALKPAIDDAIQRLLGRGVVADALRRYGVPVNARSGARRRDILPVAWQSGVADPVEGRLLFEANCEQCHGIDGRGGGAVPRLQSYPSGAEERFVRTVLEGRNSRGMP